MLVLIVEPDDARAVRWCRALEGLGGTTVTARTQAAAIRVLRERTVALVVLNLDLPEDGAFAVAEFASYARPGAKVLFVSASDRLADGSVFGHAANACGFLGADSRPEDIAAIAAYHAGGWREAG